MSTNTAPVGGFVQRRTQELAAEIVLKSFTEKELMAVRLISPAFRDVAERYLWERFTTMSGASTLLPAQANLKTLKQVVVDKLNERGFTRAASDQITSARFLNGMLGPRLTIRINVGSEAPREGIRSIPNAVQVPGPVPKGRAHAKFITGGSGVLIGSPNLTSNALEGGTVESVALIQSQRIKGYFNRYFDLMRAHTAEDARVFQRVVQTFNASNQPMSLALAPFIEIQPWLLAELDGADRLIIRMFLISNARRGEDIVKGINRMARNNPRMKVEAYIDENQTNNVFTEYFDYRQNDTVRNYYVENACFSLRENAPNVKVYTQSGPSGIMHDKLILAERDLVDDKGVGYVKKSVILGSSGFSTNVMSNNNYETMVRINNDGLYDYMMRHHRRSLNPASGVTTKNF